uniref:Uncharacterized protein n=1 Tax=Astyanax mexicanus TaxID=7994 RepID=A0A8B9RI64_ASTMX
MCTTIMVLSTMVILLRRRFSSRVQPKQNTGMKFP